MSDQIPMFDELMTCFEAQVTPILWGSPGIGKTAFARYIATQIGGRSYFICLSQREGVEVHGAQVVAGQFDYGGKSYTMTELAPPRYVREMLTSLVPCVVVFDELTTANPSVMAPTLQIISEFVASEIDLPRENIGIIACANPPDEAAGGWPLPPPMANRLCHLPYQLDPKDWAKHFPGYWGQAPTITRWGKTVPESEWIQARSLVSAYINANPDALLRVPKSSESGAKTADNLPGGRHGPWASPRTWDYVSRLLVTAKRRKLNTSQLHNLVVGTIGHGAAVSFLQWQEKMDLPAPSTLIDSPDLFDLPSTNDRTFYLMKGCVAETIYRKKQSEASPSDKALASRAVTSWLNCWKIMGMIHSNPHGPKDIAVLGAGDLAKPENHPKGAQPPVEVDQIVPTMRNAELQWGSTPAPGRRKR